MLPHARVLMHILLNCTHLHAWCFVKLPQMINVSLLVLRLQVSGLHSHAAQRLVGLTSLLAKRWLKLSQALGSSGPNQDIQVRAGAASTLLS